MKNNVSCTTQYTVPLQRLPEQTESLLKEIHAFALQTVPILFASCSIRFKTAKEYTIQVWKFEKRQLLFAVTAALKRLLYSPSEVIFILA